MSEVKHTPKPWEVQGHGGINLRGRFLYYDVKAPGENLHLSHLSFEDAHLIAAAPDLLEKLEKLVIDLDQLMESSEGVAGLHRNGEIAPWEDLTESFHFSGWLRSVNEARDLLVRLKQTQDAPPQG